MKYQVSLEVEDGKPVLTWYQKSVPNYVYKLVVTDEFIDFIGATAWSEDIVEVKDED